jgi:hypothetical protein
LVSGQNTGRNGDRDEPAYPVDSGAAVGMKGGVDEPTDENAADPAENGEPKRRVVSPTWRDDLAQQPDDDPGNDYSDYSMASPFV